MSEQPPKQFFGETRRGGTIHRRTSSGGHVYRAICDECNSLGPEAPRAVASRQIAAKAGWLCERKRMFGRFMESRSFRVLCVVCRPASAA